MNKIKKVLLDVIKNTKNFIKKNKDGIGWHSIKRNKKKLAIGLAMLGYIVFWFIYFSERNVSFKDPGNKSIQTQESIKDGKKAKVKKEKEIETVREFTKDDLKNFWLEISTDKINIKAPIVQGVEPADLKRGVGRHKTSALPNEEGNIVISGHRWKFGSNPAYKVFKDLDNLKSGDKVSIHYGGKIFEYEVFEEGVVNDNEDGFDEVMKKTDDRILTLYTCTPIGTSLRRLYYRARFIK